MTDFADIQKLATLRTRTVPLCVAGELLEEHEQLERQLAETAAPTNLGDGSRRQLAERIRDLEERMREAVVDFRLRALPGRAWQPFWADYPVREENESAKAWNDRAFPFQAELVSRTCIDPEMTPEQAAELCDMLPGGAWTRLVNACADINLGSVDVPNSFAASELIRSSEQT